MTQLTSQSKKQMETYLHVQQPNLIHFEEFLSHCILIFQKWYFCNLNGKSIHLDLSLGAQNVEDGSIIHIIFKKKKQVTPKNDLYSLACHQELLRERVFEEALRVNDQEFLLIDSSR